jgi:hypothetical protein
MERLVLLSSLGQYCEERQALESLVLILEPLRE